MSLDTTFDKFFWVMAALIIGSLLWKMLRKGGLRGAMFGAPVQRTVGEVAAVKAHLQSMTVKVHRLSTTPDRAIAIELVAKSYASYQMTPITLSCEAALELSELLRTAASESALRQS